MTHFAFDDEILIHVGLHKTGSTWLQQRLFSDPAAGFATPWGTQSAIAMSEFVFTDSLGFDACSARERLASAASGTILPSGSLPVITHEALSSRPQRGEYFAEMAAERIKKTFPSARLLLIIREQKKMIYSLYQQHVRDGGRYTLEEFVGSGEEFAGFSPALRLGFLEYDRMLEMYRSVFGEDAVLLLPMELLKSSPHEFVDRILAFAGRPGYEVQASEAVNVGMGPLTVALLRRSNGLFRTGPRPPGRRSGYAMSRRIARVLDRVIPASAQRRRERAMRKWIASRIGTRYHQGNSRLSRLIGIDLAAFGYETRGAAVTGTPDQVQATERKGG